MLKKIGTNKKGQDVYLNVLTGRKEILPYVRTVKIEKRIPDYAFAKMGLRHRRV